METPGSRQAVGAGFRGLEEKKPWPRRRRIQPSTSVCVGRGIRPTGNGSYASGHGGRGPRDRAGPGTGVKPQPY